MSDPFMSVPAAVAGSGVLGQTSAAPAPRSSSPRRRRAIDDNTSRREVRSSQGTGMEPEEDLYEMRRVVTERRQAMQDELAEFGAQEFTGQDSGGYVRVTVDGLGTVRAVRVDPGRLRALKDSELGPRVVEATRAARARMAETNDAQEEFPGHRIDPLRRSSGDAGERIL